MDFRVCFIFLAVTLCVQAQRVKDDFYTAAVVEYSPPPNADELQNLENYKKFIQKAASEGADIVVFPEGGLTKTHYPVPNPVDHVKLCQEDLVNSVTHSLSCSALQNRIYVVVNLPEKRDILGSGGKRETVKYNTNVVFDRDGYVVARYAKYNLFDEPLTDKPEKPEMSFFDTDFGVRFGTFICFDILYPEPALTLVREYNVTDFVFTTQWFSELPFLTALQVQRGWAEVNNVTLLASGYNNPGKGSTGSGIFDGELGTVVHYMGDEKTSRLLVALVMKRNRVPVAQKGHHSILSVSASESDADEKLTENLVFLSDHLEVYQSEVIPAGYDVTMDLCKNNFCCNFTLRLEKVGENPENYQYRAVAFDGVRRFGLLHTGGVQACAVVLCTGPEITNCTQRPSNLEGIYQFSRLKIQGKFRSENAFQIPTTLYLGHDQFDTLPALNYEFSTQEIPEERLRRVTLLTHAPPDGLMTFGIWGRDFSRDGQKPSNASWTSSLLSLLMASLAFTSFLV